MSTTGYVLAAAAQDIVGVFVNKANALAENDNVAYFNTASRNATATMEVYNFGFDSLIPSGATIDQVNIQVRDSVTSGFTNRAWAALSGVAGTTHDTTDTALTTHTYSAEGRPGGGTWARADLLDGVFSVRFMAVAQNSTTNRYYNLAWVEVEVVYTEAGGTEYPQAVAVTATVSPVISRQPRKPLAVAASLGAALVRGTRKIVSTSLSATAGIATSKVKQLVIAVTSAVSAAVSRRSAKAVAATSTLAAAVSRRSTKTLAAASILAADMVRWLEELGPELVRQVGKKVLTTLSATIGLVSLKTLYRTIAVTVGLGVGIAKRVLKAFAIGVSFSVSANKRVSKNIAATVSLAAALVKRVSKAVASSVSLTAGLSRQIGKAISLGASFAVSFTRKTAKTIAVTVSHVVDIARQFIGGGGDLFFQAVAVTVSMTTAVTRRVGKVVSPIFTVAVNLTRAVKMTLAQGITFVVAAGKRQALAIAVSVSLAVGVVAHTAEQFFQAIAVGVSMAAGLATAFIKKVRGVTRRSGSFIKRGSSPKSWSR